MVSFRIGGFKFFSSKKPTNFDPSDDVLQGCRHKLRVERGGGGLGGGREGVSIKNCPIVDPLM